MDIKKLIERLRTESLYADKASLEIMDLCMEAATALSALRPVSREQVEKAWRAHWNESTHLGGFVYCSRCGYNALEANNYTFCPKCGSPFTDEAVEMVMERMEALHDNRT